MSNEIVKTNQEVAPAIIQSLILEGDISKMNPQQKVEYTTKLCQSLGLNVLTQPFQIIKFQGKEKLYATKDCTEQLRKVHGVSVTESTSEKIEDMLIVRVKVVDKNNRSDVGTGVVVTKGLNPTDLANAYMKCETKAKRRATLSICGMGMLDESELDTMPIHTTQVIPTQEQKPTVEVSPVKEYTASEEQLIWIESLMQTTSASEEKVVALERRIAEGLTTESAEKAIAWLKENQINNMKDGKGNYSTTDITNQIKKEIL